MHSALTRYVAILGGLTVFFILPITVKAAESQESAGSNISAVYLDDITAERGYVALSANGLFRLHLPPQSVSQSTVTIAMDEVAAYPVIPNFKFASKVYTIDFAEGISSQPRHPLWVEFAYPPDSVGLKSIAVFHKERGVWEQLPARRDPEQHRIRAAIPWTFGRFAVFESTKALEVGEASWYHYRSCRCAASPDYAKGTKLRVTNLENGKVVIIRVNDFGPNRSVFPNRIIDLDHTAFRELKHPRYGLATVLVEPLL